MYKRDVSLRVRYEYNVRITFFVRFVYERLKERYLEGVLGYLCQFPYIVKYALLHITVAYL